MTFNNSLMPWKWGRKNVPVRREDSFLEPSKFLPLQHDLNNVFENFFRSLGSMSLSPFGEMTMTGEFQPRADVIESAKELRVSVELPGLDEKDLDVSIAADAILVRGEKREENEENTSGYYRMERHYGSFYRTIPLPCSVDKDSAKASFKRGVLTVVLPKSKESEQEVRKIIVDKE